MTDLAATSGMKLYNASDVNESGVVITECLVDGKPEACLWDKGNVTLIGPLEDAYPHQINNRGQVVGDDADHAVLWRKGSVRYIVAGAAWSHAEGINDRGQVVGSYSGGGHAFLWENGVMTDLENLGVNGDIYGINNLGQMVGESRTSSGEYHATLWTR